MIKARLRSPYIDLEQIRCGAMDAGAVFHQEHHTQLSIHQADKVLPGRAASLTASGLEPLVVMIMPCACAPGLPAHLLHERGRYVVFELSFLDLNSHLDVNHVTHHQGFIGPDVFWVDWP